MTGVQVDFDPALAPLVRTEIPGPRSQELWARDAAFHASNSSPPAQWLRLVLEDGRGAVVRDVDGNLFVDFSSGAVVANLGHAPPTVAAAVAEEAGRLMHYFDFATPARPAFFEALARTLPPALQTFQMYSTGAEAVEAALRLAKSYTGNYEVISFHQAWHGRTLGAMALMGGFPLKRGYGPFAPGVFHSPNANCYRCPLELDRDDCAIASASLVDQVYEQATEQRLAAVIVEPVQGVGGVIPFPPEFLSRLRHLCDRTGALLIFDEILTGVGRTGPMWAFESSGVVPDVLLAGKGLACAAGAATLALLEDGAILANGRRVGAAMLAALRELAGRHPMIGDVRGVGMLLALDLVTDRTAKTPVPPATVRRLVLALARRGVLIAGAAPVLRITPPLVIEEEMALAGAALLDEALAEVEAEAA